MVITILKHLEVYGNSLEMNYVLLLIFLLIIITVLRLKLQQK